MLQSVGLGQSLYSPQLSCSNKSTGCCRLFYGFEHLHMGN